MPLSDTPLYSVSALILVGAGPPPAGAFGVAAFLGEIGAARGRHPAHHLGRREVHRVAAHFPDPLVGLMPALQGGVDEPGEPTSRPGAWARMAFCSPGARRRLYPSRGH